MSTLNTTSKSINRALIIGASSGIGEALAIVLANHGYEVGLMARREEMLHAVQAKIPSVTHGAYLDITQPSDALERVEKMVAKMGDIKLVILNAGVGFFNQQLDWATEKQTIDTNVCGFCALAGFFYRYFEEKGSGHIVGISSIAALRGNHVAPAYNASKAFMSNYLEGLQKKASCEKTQIRITDIKPGFVDTDMIKAKKTFWVASPRKAAEQIYKAIVTQKKHAYVTRRWRLIGWLMKKMPNWLYFKI